MQVGKTWAGRMPALLALVLAGCDSSAPTKVDHPQPPAGPMATADEPVPPVASADPAPTEPTSPAAIPAAEPAAGGGRADTSPPRSRVVNTAARGAGGVLEITFDTIKFPMEKEDPFDRSLLTPEILQLVGQPVRIRGYILPSFQQSGIKQFVLVRDNLECCFGPGAALFDCIVVEMKPGKSTDYTVRPVSVEGTFSLKEEINPDDGKHLAIYHLDGEKVQ